jgi:hypothetical protein
MGVGVQTTLHDEKIVCYKIGTEDLGLTFFGTIFVDDITHVTDEKFC